MVRQSIELLVFRLYTAVRKTGPFFSFEHNFRKYCPILIILSLLQTEIICPQNFAHKNLLIHI